MPHKFKLRTDGWYTSDDSPTLSFAPVTGDGRRYLAMRAKYGYGHYAITIMHAEKLYAKQPSTAAWQARAGTTYLLTNASLYDRALKFGGADPSFILQSIPDLSGYLFTPGLDIVDASVDNALARMFLLIPQGNGRDLNDIAVVVKGSEEWLRQGSTLYRPLAGVVPLAAGGPSTVSIGSEGFNEWRKLPATGSVSINGADGWRLYGADLKLIASGTGNGRAAFTGNAGNFLMLFGTAGSAISLIL